MTRVVQEKSELGHHGARKQSDFEPRDSVFHREQTREYSDHADTAEDWQQRRPKYLLPLIRHVSCRVTPWLVRMPLTANQVTMFGILCGLLAVYCFVSDSLAVRILGAFAFFLTALCDHCDGEVARLKQLESRLGDFLSEAGGTLVEAVLWLAIAWKVAQDFDNPLWLWFGVSVAVGVLLNFVVALLFKVQPEEQTAHDEDFALSITPHTFSAKASWKERALYAFRELLPADLWILYAALGISGMLWILLPLAAFGVHVFWLLGMTKQARRFHA